MKKLAVCIGIDNYSGNAALNGCINDAKEWAVELTSRGFSTTVIEDATYATITDTIKELAEKAEAGDHVWIFYAGHGTQLPDDDTHEVGEDDKLDEALVPIDYLKSGYIRDDDIGLVLDALPTGAKLTVVFDCCHSGTATRTLFAHNAMPIHGNVRTRFLQSSPAAITADLKRRRRTRSVPLNRARQEMKEILFAASAANETSKEINGHGVFTTAAMSVLRSKNSFSNQQFINAVKQKLQEQQGQMIQTPQLDCDTSRLSESLFGGELLPIGSSSDSKCSTEGIAALGNAINSLSNIFRDVCLSNFTKQQLENEMGLRPIDGDNSEPGKPTKSGSRQAVPLDRDVSTGGTCEIHRDSKWKLLPEISGRSRKVIGDDERVEIRDTSKYPYSCICNLSLSFSGTSMRGTGWLAGPRLVITAGHCVYDHKEKLGELTGATITTGSGLRARAVQWRAPQGWVNHADSELDYGAIFLDTPLGDAEGTLGYGVFSDSDLSNCQVNVVGYPAEPELRNKMYGCPDQISEARNRQLFYLLDTSPGQSGAPVILWDGDSQYWSAGIHTSYDPNSDFGQRNVATRISPTVLANIRKWRKESES